MMDAPEISVVMANYNGSRHLAAAIRSLQHQTFQSWELIFVDDLSSDDSVAAAVAAADGDPRVAILQQSTNLGPAAARNRAIGRARGNWIAVFDSDDIMRPQRLEALLDRARRDAAAIVVDDLLLFSEQSATPKNFLPRNFAREPRWIGLAEFIDSNRLHSRVPDLGYLKPFIAMNLLRDSRVRYDERLRIGEDYDFMARLLAHGARMRLEPEAHYLYRRHPNSTSYRLKREHILALIEADRRFASETRPLTPEEAMALDRRTQSLHSLLLYDRVVTLTKAGHYREAASTGLGAPRIWPLLVRPIRARASRLYARLAPSSSAAQKEAR